MCSDLPLSPSPSRELTALAECAAALKRVLHGDRPTWVEWDALDHAWTLCQARGVQPPEEAS